MALRKKPSAKASQLLEQAVFLHQSGRLQEAAALYQSLLNSLPAHPQLLTGLGILALQRGKLEEGVGWLGKSLQILAKQPEALFNHAIALALLKRREEAVLSFNKLLILKPDYAEGYANRGNVLQELKLYSQALTDYDRAITLKPDDADTYYNKGSVLKEMGLLDEALENLNKAIALNPDYIEAYNNRGLVLQELNQLEAALSSFDQAITLQPNYADAYNNRGNVLQALNKPDEALHCFDQAIRLRTDFALAYYNRASALRDLQQYQAALTCIDQAIALDSTYAYAYHLQGNILQELDQLQLAVISYELAMSLKADYAEVLVHLGDALRKLKRSAEAVVCYEKAIAINPGDLTAQNNRGIALQQLHQYPTALAAYDHTISLKPDFADAHNNRGIVLKDLLRLEEALSAYQQAISINPDFVEAYSNQGLAHQLLQQFDQALACFERAITVNREYSHAYVNKALLKLLLGDYKEGWRLFEWRWQSEQKIQNRHYPQPRWLGETRITNQTILIYPEQGLGDFIQFCRYLPLLENLQAKVIVETPPELTALIKTLGEDIRVVEQGQPLPDFDVYCPIMSLPLAFKTTVATIPANIPYLHPAAEQSDAWQEKLGKTAKLKVGLVWSGSTIHTGDALRSIPLRQFELLLGLPVEFHALQKQIRAEDEAALLQFKHLHQHHQELGDFSDTAGLLAAMDLIISVDTSVAHLAGAMGKPVWILLPFAPDFRWLLDRIDSPWYPTTTLFRQSIAGDWSTVIFQVAENLLAFAKKPEYRDRYNHDEIALFQLNQAEYIDIYVNQGIIHQNSQAFRTAIACYDQVLKIRSDFPEILINRGLAYQELKQYPKALADYAKAIALRPEFAEAHNNHAIALHKLKQYQAAVLGFDRAIALKPDYAAAYNNRGMSLLELNRFAEARANFEQAIALIPDYGYAHCNLGNALLNLYQAQPSPRDRNLLNSALANLNKSIALQPDDADAHNNRGNVLKELQCYPEALAAYQQAIALKTDFADAYSNQGILLMQLKQFDQALASFDHAIALNPENAEAYWNKALLHILLGDYRQGWQLYEWRWQSLQKHQIRNFTQPLWLGEQPIRDQTILIHPEQGLGDFIQFCRYLPMLENLGAKVILETPPSLFPLLNTFKGDHRLIKEGEPSPAFNWQCPIMSLPLAFKTTLETIPAGIPYLYADNRLVKIRQEKLGKKTKFRVGLVWSGSTHHQGDGQRSLQLEQLADLLSLPLEFYALQREIRRQDAADLHRFKQLQVHQHELTDFAETAALVAAMDLVISVDTSVAHLAGAMAKPLWILLPYAPDYRWLLDRTDSPWYPTATLFRQPAEGDWSTLISQVVNKLSAMTKHKP